MGNQQYAVHSFRRSSLSRSYSNASKQQFDQVMRQKQLFLHQNGWHGKQPTQKIRPQNLKPLPEDVLNARPVEQLYGDNRPQIKEEEKQISMKEQSFYLDPQLQKQCTGLLVMNFSEPDSTEFGVGTAIGKNIIVTCAHNCYNRKQKKLATQILFYIDVDHPIPVTKILYSKQFSKNQQNDIFSKDLAILVLQQEITGNVVKLKTSTNSLPQSKHSIFIQNIVNLTENIKEIKFDKETQLNKLACLTQNQFTYESSKELLDGAPIFIEKAGECFLVGIHIDKVKEPKRYRGLVLNNMLFNDIQQQLIEKEQLNDLLDKIEEDQTFEVLQIDGKNKKFRVENNEEDKEESFDEKIDEQEKKEEKIQIEQMKEAERRKSSFVKNPQNHMNMQKSGKKQKKGEKKEKSCFCSLM